jgi:hypothetical protein
MIFDIQRKKAWDTTFMHQLFVVIHTLHLSFLLHYQSNPVAAPVVASVLAVQGAAPGAASVLAV